MYYWLVSDVFPARSCRGCGAATCFPRVAKVRVSGCPKDDHASRVGREASVACTPAIHVVARALCGKDLGWWG